MHRIARSSLLLLVPLLMGSAFPDTARAGEVAPSPKDVAAALLRGSKSERQAAENTVQRHLGTSPRDVAFRLALRKELAADIVRRELLLDGWIAEARSRDIPRREKAVRLLTAMGDAGIRRLLQWVQNPLLSNDPLTIPADKPEPRDVQQGSQGRNRVGARDRAGHKPVVYKARDFARFELTPAQILATLRDVPSASRIDQMRDVYLVFASPEGHARMQAYLEGVQDNPRARAPAWSQQARPGRATPGPRAQRPLPTIPEAEADAETDAETVAPPAEARPYGAPGSPAQPAPGSSEAARAANRMEPGTAQRSPVPPAGAAVPPPSDEPSQTMRPHVEPRSAPDLTVVGDARGWRTTPVVVRVPRSDALMQTLAGWPGMPAGNDSPRRAEGPLVVPGSSEAVAAWLERAPKLANARTLTGTELRIQGGNEARGFVGEVLPYRRKVEQVASGSWEVVSDAARTGVELVVRIARPQAGPFAGRVCGRVLLRARDIARPLRTVRVRPDAETSAIELDELEWLEETSVGLAPLSAAGGGMMVVVPDPGAPSGMLMLIVAFERGGAQADDE